MLSVDAARPLLELVELVRMQIQYWPCSTGLRPNWHDSNRQHSSFVVCSQKERSMDCLRSLSHQPLCNYECWVEGVMPLLGLCAHVGRLQQRSGNTPGDSYGPRLLPQTPWFLRLVRDHGLEKFCVSEDTKLASRVHSSCEVIANVRRGTVYQGPLTPWSEEEEFWWDLFGRPYSVCSLRIQSAVALQRAAVVHRPGRLQALIWTSQVALPRDVPSGVATPVKSSSNSDAMSEESFLETLQVTRSEMDKFLAQPVCFAVPPVVLELVKRGAWGSLMMWFKWHSPKRGAGHVSFAEKLHFEALHKEWLQQDVLNKHVPLPSLPFTAQDALALARDLKSWAGAILDATTLDDELFNETFLSLEQFVLKLQSFAGVWHVPVQNPRAHQNRHSHDTVVKALCACLNLRNRKELGNVVCMALDTVFPGLSHDVKYKNPSASALSRKQILVDAAWSCYWADLLNQHRGPIFLWADSSPQGGVDWLLSIVSLVKEDDLERTARAANVLAGSSERFAEALNCDDKQAMASIAEQRESLGTLLEQTMVMHRQVPMALGSGSTSLEQKTKCMLRKLFYESQSQSNLQVLMERVCCFCTDMGTELSLPDVSGVSATDVLPNFMFDAGLCSEEHMPASDAGPSEFLFPRALLVPGVLHVCHNMQKSINSSLPMWGSWLGSFKALAHSLHSDALRQRLIAFCVRGSAFEWVEDVFKRGVPKPIEWRWGNVVAILPEILACKRALQAVWDPARFKQEGDVQQDDRSEACFSVETVTNAVKSNKFWLQCEMILKLNQVAQAGFCRLG